MLQRSNVVLEGKIAFVYRGYLPGISPPTEALFCIFAQSPSKVRGDHLGYAVFESRADIGFWVYENEFVFAPGDTVRVHLWVVMPDKGTPFLMVPTDSKNAVVNSSDGKSLKLTSRLKVNDLPVIYAAPDFMDGGPGRDWISLWSRLIPRWSINMPAGGNLPFEVHSHRSQQAHYAIQFVPSIPPNEPLGRTNFIASRGDRLLIRFNTRYSYSDPDFDGFDETIDAFTLPTEDEYDFPTLAMHELGHSLGIEHIDSDALNASQYIMYESVDKGVPKRQVTGYDYVEIALRYQQ
ncbi:MAG: matrixin family metalloprotease [Pirellulales bacterium]